MDKEEAVEMVRTVWIDNIKDLVALRKQLRVDTQARLEAELEAITQARRDAAAEAIRAALEAGASKKALRKVTTDSSDFESYVARGAELAKEEATE